MLSDLARADALYDALVARDPAYDGVAFAAVRTTGVFCRLTCPARKPRRENTIFFESPAACLSAGFRPCLRCRPLARTGEPEPLIEDLVCALDCEPDKRWREADLAAMGFDPSTVRRAFKRHFGATFLEMARARRIGRAADQLSAGARVIEAQVEAGFESGSGFRAAVTRVLGRAPAKVRRGNCK